MFIWISFKAYSNGNGICRTLNPKIYVYHDLQVLLNVALI